MAAHKMVVISSARWSADICSGGVSLIGFMVCKGHLNDPQIMIQIFQDDGQRRATPSNQQPFLKINAPASKPVNQVSNSSNLTATAVSPSSTGSSDTGRFNCHARAPSTFTK
jgi:hypothetical protein